MFKKRSISSENMGHHGRRGKGNVRAQKQRARARHTIFTTSGSMHEEDLTQWKPIYKLVYAGYRRGSKSNAPTREGRVIIHMNNEEHIGGFYLYEATAKIWWQDGYVQKVIHIPIQFCTFTKRRDGDLNIYDVVIDSKKVDLLYGNDKQGVNMVDVNDKGEVVIKAPPEKVSILDRVSGRTGAIYNKDREEGKLTELWNEFEAALKDIDVKNDDLKDVYVEIPALKMELEKEESEWRESLSSLGNVLEKSKEHEWKMWQETQKNRKFRTQKNAPRIKYSDVDEMNFNSTMDFIKQYPELQAQETIRNAINEIQKKRMDILSKHSEYQQAIAKYNGILNKFEKKLQKTEDDLEAFEERMKESAEKVNNHPYNKSKLFGTLKTDYEKQATRLDTLKYEGKIKERKNKLGIIKSELSNYERKRFVDIEN